MDRLQRISRQCHQLQLRSPHRISVRVQMPIPHRIRRDSPLENAVESAAAHGFTATQIVTNRVPERPSAAVGSQRQQRAVNAATRLPVTIAANIVNGRTAANITTKSRTSAPPTPAPLVRFHIPIPHRLRRDSPPENAVESAAAHGFTATQIVTNRAPGRPSAAVGNRRWQPAVNAATRLPVTIATNFANGRTAAHLTTMSRTSARSPHRISVRVQIPILH
jgi:hypothetical protein